MSPINAITKLIIISVHEMYSTTSPLTQEFIRLNHYNLLLPFIFPSKQEKRQSFEVF